MYFNLLDYKTLSFSLQYYTETLSNREHHESMHMHNIQ